MMAVDRLNLMDYPSRPKRSRNETHRVFEGLNPNQKTLELDGVIRLMRQFEDCPEGGINCSICGKLYKSKVCFAKHLWEHSIYWDLFDGAKNHDRVLSIQAAVILYSGYQTQDNNNANSNNNEQSNLNFLLVTAPHAVHEKKVEKDANCNDISARIGNNKNAVLNNNMRNRGSPGKRNGSPLKRKKSFEIDD